MSRDPYADLPQVGSFSVTSSDLAERSVVAVCSPLHVSVAVWIALAGVAVSANRGGASPRSAAPLPTGRPILPIH